MCGGGGGSGGQRPLEQEERDLLRMQTRVAEQGIGGRDRAMVGYQGFAQRGREMGSIARQDAEAGRYREDATASLGTARRMREARMASMGVNPGDPRFSRGQDVQDVSFAGQTASGMNAARANTRAEGLKTESAGYAGLAGFDPSGALSSMGSTLNASANRQMASDRASAEGWGQLGMGAMYGLANADKIEKGASTIAGWFADGGEVPSYADGGEVMGVRRYASGGNVYDRAMDDVGQMRSQGPRRGPAAPEGGGMMVDPISATRVAKTLVDSAASSLTPTPAGMGFKAPVGGGEMFGLGGEGAGVGFKAGAGGAEMLGAEMLGAEGAAMLGAGAAEGAAAASALGTVGAALPWIGGGLMVGNALGLFADGGAVGINRRANGGVAENPNGGKVSGPGGPKDDMVPAYLSPGEFVLPVGTVRKYGLQRLEKMRQEGLEFERQQAA